MNENENMMPDENELNNAPDVSEGSAGADEPIGENTENAETEETTESTENTVPHFESGEVLSENDKTAEKHMNSALRLSAILSACSLILLVALTLALMTGFLPVKSHVVYLPAVNDTPTQPDTEVSPDVLEDFLNSVVIVTGNGITSTTTGTGVIISPDGYIVTNYHVIEGCPTVGVNLYGEKTAQKAEIVGFHKEDDVAVLKINRTGLRAATFVDSDAVRYGEKVYAIGTPETLDFGWSVTQGIVSSPRRQLMIYDEEGVLERKMNVVQTDAPINKGNSGGPLINVRGEVVGIITLKRNNTVGMGFALPSDGVLIDAKAIIETGSADSVNSGISIKRPIIGIVGVGVRKNVFYENYTDEEGSGVRVVTEEYAKVNPSTTFYATATGVRINSVIDGSDAAAKLQVGDIITEVNGNAVSTVPHIMNIVNEYDSGDSVSLKFYRDGKFHTVDIILGSDE